MGKSSWLFLPRCEGRQRQYDELGLRSREPGLAAPARLESRFLKGGRSGHRRRLPGKGRFKTRGREKSDPARWAQNLRRNSRRWRTGGTKTIVDRAAVIHFRP